MPANDCDTANPPLGSKIACGTSNLSLFQLEQKLITSYIQKKTERLESCLSNATGCNVLNLNNHVSDLTSASPFSAFGAFNAPYINELIMNNASLPSTFLVDYPDFFVGIESGLLGLTLKNNGIVDLNADRLHEILTSLFLLDVSDNELTSLDICSAREPGNLRVLTISGNNISHYDNFDGCGSNIGSVVMHRNQLTNLSAYSLSSQSVGGSSSLYGT